MISRVDPGALALRLVAAFFLFTITVWFLFLIGSAQSFYEETLLNLFVTLRWLTWIGIIVSWGGLVPWFWNTRRWVASGSLAFGFTLLFGLVLVWGSWVYPSLRTAPW